MPGGTSADASEVTSRIFRDFYGLRRNLVGWDSEPVQLGAGTLTTRFDQVRSGGVTAYYLTMDRLLSDRSAHIPGELAYVICFTPKKWCGLEVPAGSIVIKGPAREHSSLLVRGWESVTIHIPDELADASGYPYNSVSYPKLPIQDCVIRLPERFVTEFRVFARSLSSPFGSRQDPSDRELWAHATRERALQLLGRVMAEIGRPPKADTQLGTVGGYDLIASSMAYFDQKQVSRVSIEELASATGVTSRTLQTVFRRYFGVTPNQYMLARRLQMVRQEIMRRATSGREVSVTEAAVALDFEHLSRFAQHYRRLFGELPSQTLHGLQTTPH